VPSRIILPELTLALTKVRTQNVTPMPSKLIPCWHLALLWATFIALLPLNAQAEFATRSGSAYIEHQVLTTTARLSLSITGDPAEALSKGIPLTILVETRLYRASLLSRFFEIATWQHPYLIEYHALSNRYTLTRPGAGPPETFPTLSETLGAIEDFSVELNLPPGVAVEDRLEVRLRTVLDRSDLPGPLKLMAFFSNDWQLQSNWQRWKVVHQ